jgi:hypothetical protein
MKILIGILHSNEPQFKDCVDSVKLQKYDYQFDYFVISNKTKNEAHDLLYKNFMSNSNQYDLFLKLDADMIIKKKDFFKYISNLFILDDKLDWVRLLLYDHFLKENISGLNIYRSSVKWNTNKANYFTDRILDVRTVRKDLGIDPDKQWLTHCENASLYQHFNFGFHRAIKLFQFDSKVRLYSYMHWNVFIKIYRLYSVNKDLNSLLILSTLIYVYKYKITGEAINESSIVKHNAFKFLTDLSDNNLKKFVETDNVYFCLKLGYIGYFLLFNFRSYIVKLN